MKRTKLRDRLLPNYSRGEEVFNMTSHIVGGALGVLVLILCICRAVLHRNIWSVVGSAVYGATFIQLYTISSIYHGLRPGTGKKVLQIIDH
ncbi:MAG: hemolysin III family protein, partial [Clostridia bacterium]|nr:hemolysin III family protein [Clostridia bacterium]